MSEYRDAIDPDRLLDAVDAIQEAGREMGLRGLPSDPVALLGAPEQPEALCDFTREEIEEAASFLRRMGFLNGSHETHR